MKTSGISYETVMLSSWGMKQVVSRQRFIKHVDNNLKNNNDDDDDDDDDNNNNNSNKW